MTARGADWLPRARRRSTDLLLLARIVRRGWVRVIRERGRPVAFIARNGGRIHALYVHPAAQGRGHARTLLDEAKTCQPDLDLWVIRANARARAVYATQGFGEAAHSHGSGNDENLPDILMVWNRRGRRTA